MKTFLLALALIVLAPTAKAADNIICSGNGSSQCYLLDNDGNKWDASVAFTTDGAGDIFTLGDVASTDNVLGVGNSSNRTLIDNSSRRWRAAVFYTTDGSGNVIPVPSGGGGGGSPGGGNQDVQFNSSGSFGGSSSFKFDGTTVTAPILNLAPATDVTALVTVQPSGTPTADIEDHYASDGTTLLANIDSSGKGYFNEIYIGGAGGARLFFSGGQLVTPNQFVLGEVFLSSGLLVTGNLIRYAAAGGANSTLDWHQDDGTGAAIQVDTSATYSTGDLFDVNNNGTLNFKVTNTGAATATGGLVSTRTSYAWYSAGSCSSALTVDWTNGPHQMVTLTGNCTLTMSNPLNGEWHSLEIIQGGSGSYTLTWPAAYKWQGGTPPTLSTSVGAIDVVSDGYDGTIYLANFGGNYH